MQFPPPRRSTARGGMRPQAAPPPRRPPAALDPVPFPGGAEAALEFAAYEKGLLERGSNNRGSTRDREPPPAPRRTPTSEPDRHSMLWMLAGAGMAAIVILLLLLLGSGLLTTGSAAALWPAARP